MNEPIPCPANCLDGKVHDLDYYGRDVWGDCPECSGRGYVRCEEPGCFRPAETAVNDVAGCLEHAAEWEELAA